MASYAFTGSSLPSVLKTYDPAFEVVPRPKPPKPAAEPAEKPTTPELTDDSQQQEPSDVQQRRPSEAQHSRSPTKGAESPRRGSRRRSPTKVDAMMKSQKEARERRFKWFNRWNEVRQEMKEEDTDRLKDKIRLQMQLIRARDQAREQREWEEEQRRREEREEARRNHRDMIRYLQNTCQESLELDRRRQRRARPRPKATVESRADYDDPIFIGSETPEDSMTPILSPTKHPTMDLAREFTVGSTLTELSETEQASREETEDILIDDDDAPKHHTALYNLYGREMADYFLYPKMATEKKTNINKIKERLNIDTDRADIHDIWRGLRDGSNNRLKQEDLTITEELKTQIDVYRQRVQQEAAYRAFTRDSIAKEWPTVERNFTQQMDVPEMALLKDRQVVERAELFRHQVAIMSRKSGINQDTIRILMHNNPLPNLNDLQGEESVSKYLPSWDEVAAIEEGAEEEEETEADRPETRSSSRKEKRKDVPCKLRTRELTDLTMPSKWTLPTTSGQDYETTLFTEDWEALPRGVRTAEGGRRRSREWKSQEPLVFLTEKDATVPGKFRERCLAREQKALEPKSSVPEAMSAMARICGREPGEPKTPPPPPRIRSLSDVHTKPVVLWEPLSLAALTDYKKFQKAMGAGPFKQGLPPLYRPLKV